MKDFFFKPKISYYAVIVVLLVITYVESFLVQLFLVVLASVFEYWIYDRHQEVAGSDTKNLVDSKE